MPLEREISFEKFKAIDILEDDIMNIDPRLLKKLLLDKTTKGNILWCTKDYEALGPGYGEREEIQPERITGQNARVIQPRAAKPKEVQELRVRKRAEVFTPSWICNEQNNQVDEAWFGRANVFNTPNGSAWLTAPGKIEFPGKKKTWKAYVDAKRLEITCGEAPYLVSRYDTTTGALIPAGERIGLFDRKMRVVNENCPEEKDWLEWSFRALKSVYGFEFQGDSLLIARENLLYDYIDYYRARFREADPPFTLLLEAANIIAWNLWQMDGLKGVVPYSCHDFEFKPPQPSLLEEQPEIRHCPGCEKNDMSMHNGMHCRIFDWTNYKKSIPYLSLFK